MRLSNVVDEFITEYRVTRSIETVRKYEATLDAFSAWLTVTAADNLVSFTSEAVRAFFLMRAGKGLALGTLQRERAALSEFAQFCRRRRKIVHDPMTDTPSVKQPKRLPRRLTHQAADKLTGLTLASAEERVIRGLLFEAGLRVSEVCGLAVEHIELGDHPGQGMIHVRHGKGDKDRSVPPSDALWHLLHDYLLSTAAVDRPKAPLLAQPNGKPWTTPMIRRRMHAWARAAGLTDRVTPHRARHTFATEMLESGADLVQVQKALGHADLNTTAVYLDVTVTRLREAINLRSRVRVPIMDSQPRPSEAERDSAHPHE